MAAVVGGGHWLRGDTIKPSRVMEMLYLLSRVVVTQVYVCTQVRAHQAEQWVEALCCKLYLSERRRKPTVHPTSQSTLCRDK